MPKTMRESKMLERVRRWRAEAYEAMRRQPEAARRRAAEQWATRLNLPMVREEAEKTDTVAQLPGQSDGAPPTSAGGSDDAPRGF